MSDGMTYKDMVHSLLMQATPDDLASALDAKGALGQPRQPRQPERPKVPTYPKTPRFDMNCLVTEKIDGTNGVIVIDMLPPTTDGGTGCYTVRVGSRKRELGPGKDNFGFYAWVKQNEQALIETLGVGTHFGEWWGKGIQRGYGQEVKTFSLFDGPGRYPSLVDPDCEDAVLTQVLEGGNLTVVPLLWQGSLDQILGCDPGTVREFFLPDGSHAAPGYEKTEGVIVSLRGSGGGQRFKIVWDKG